MPNWNFSLEIMVKIIYGETLSVFFMSPLSNVTKKHIDSVCL
jgi:hypothetical protein